MSPTRRAVSLTLLVGIAASAIPGTPSSGAVVRAAAAPPPTTAQRVAYTDDRDDLYTTQLGELHGQLSVAERESRWLDPDATIVHRGELSVTDDGGRAVFVSTVDNAEGEIYLRSGGDDPVRVTCNQAIETHPVVRPDGVIAFESDARGNPDIWLAWARPEHAEEPRGCTDYEFGQLTSSPAADTWPTWAPGNGGNQGGRVVFSSARVDPLGDLFASDVPSAFAELVAEDGLVRLTDSPYAETQPAFAMVHRELPYIAFTTTQFRDDGSLGAIAFSGTDAPAGMQTVMSLWPGADDPALHRQGGMASSEAAWSPYGYQIAFVSPQDDPYGDVFVATIETDNGGRPSVTGPPLSAAGERGRAESHPAWLAPFSSRGDYYKEALLGYTSRVLEADLGSVDASDGTSLRTLADELPDEAGAAYSPDGARMVWTQGPSSFPRQLMVGNADGSDAVPLAYERGDHDVDVDPAWSPDGTRIAFTRYRWNGDAFEPPAIWIADLTERGPAPTRRASEPPADSTPFAEEHATWAPDGSSLAVGRTYPGADLEPSVEASRAFAGTPFAATITVHNRGLGRSSPSTVTSEFSAGLEFVDAPDECTWSAPRLTCTVPPINKGVPSAFVVLLRSAEAGTRGITTVAEAVPSEANVINNRTTYQFEVMEPPDLAIDLVSTEIWGEVGHLRNEIKATIENVGPVQADPTTVVFTIPADVRLVAPYGSRCSRGGTSGETEITCEIAALLLGAETTITIGVEPQRESYKIEATVTPLLGEVALVDNDYTLTVYPHVEVPVVPLQRQGTTPARTDIAFFFQRPPEMRIAKPAPTIVPATSRDEPSQIVPPSASPSPLPPGPVAQSGIWIIDVASGAAAALPAPQPCGEGCAVAGRSPAWSPDGLHIAFSDRGALRIADLADGNGDAVADMPLATSAIRHVTGFDPTGRPTASRAAISVAEDPAWFPDRAELAFAGQPAGQPDQRGIYAIAPDGSGLREIVQGRGAETEPAVSPPPTVRPTEGDLTAEVTLASATGWTGGRPVEATLTVTNIGRAPATDVAITLTLPDFLAITTGGQCSSATCPVGALAPGDSRTTKVALAMPPPIVVVDAVGPPPPRIGEVLAQAGMKVADPSPENNVDRASLTVLQPHVRLFPAVVEPGQVVLAYVENIPPADRMSFAWSKGVSLDPRPVGARTEQDTTLVWPLLLVRRDLLGQREVIVHSASGRFADVRGSLLVVAPSVGRVADFVARG